MLTFALPDERATERLGKTLAQVALQSPLSAIFLKGTLGAGKTTLVRALVSALPGGSLAEIASPSFTICNLYTTEPPVHHFDLYRLEPFTLDENLEESLDNGSALTIIEWSEQLPKDSQPYCSLEITLTHPCNADSSCISSQRVAQCVALDSKTSNKEFEVPCTPNALLALVNECWAKENKHR